MTKATPTINCRSQERTCLVCGAAITRTRTLDVEADDGDLFAFRMEVGVCDQHKDEHDDHLLECFQVTGQADLVHDQALAFLDHAEELLKLETCFICDRKPSVIRATTLTDEQANQTGREQGEVLLVPLCNRCECSNPNAWLEAFMFDTFQD